MTKRSLYAFLLGTALLALPITLNAQTVAELKPTGQWLVNSAGIQGVAAAGNKTPCIMANQYNNGFILRLSGGGQQLLSLSLDFRQNAFTQGDHYPAILSVDGGNAYNLEATAFSPGILLIGLRDAQGIYAAAQNGHSLALNVAGNTIIFSLDNMRQGLQRLESCYSPPAIQSQPAPQKIATAAPIATTPDTEVYVKRSSYPEFKQPSAQDLLKADSQPAPAVVAPAVPGNPAAGVPALPPLTKAELAQLDLDAEELTPTRAGMTLPPTVKPVKLPQAQSVPVVQAEPITPLPVQKVAAVTPPQQITPPAPQKVAAVTPMASEAIASPMPLTPSPMKTTQADVGNAEAMQQWDAKAGEDIKIVLSRWAERAGTDLVWEADNGGKVAQDVSVNGSFEEAVAQVMADNAAAMGIRGQFAQGDTVRAVNAASPVAAMRAPTPVMASAAMPLPRNGRTTVWSAAKGDDLKAVLQRWADQNNVDLKWQSDQRFALTGPVSEQGDFANAIEAALTQFDEQNVRPVGQLNRDPATGQMSLTIQTDRAS